MTFSIGGKVKQLPLVTFVCCDIFKRNTICCIHVSLENSGGVWSCQGKYQKAEFYCITFFVLLSSLSAFAVSSFKSHGSRLGKLEYHIYHMLWELFFRKPCCMCSLQVDLHLSCPMLCLYYFVYLMLVICFCFLTFFESH